MSYSLIALKALGPTAKVVTDVMIFMTQFSFAMSLISFITQVWKSFALQLGSDMGIWTVACILMLILAPVAFVRNISKFSFTFLLGNLCILTTVVVVCTIMIQKLSARNFELGEGVEWMNYSEYANIIGFSCYAYEGIGCVMPIMQACDCPEHFDKILMLALLTLAVVYISYSEIVYLTLG